MSLTTISDRQPQVHWASISTSFYLQDSINVTRPVTVLGFDFGMSRIGIAVGQSITNTASPLTIVTARDGIPNWDDIDGFITSWQPSYLVVGDPINMDGSDSEMAGLARKFARRIEARWKIPSQMVDERLSSSEAHALSTATHIDDVAAVLITETWLAIHAARAEKD
ncbi:MAG: Holliday junction resolvase RuvX [Gammaproteobacteria bacterium]|nr:Holliday junction resolvase RuvX [Gammaproteobacteria bacterium]OUU06461.1 MAG: Holliday junction resolvase RuvX [Gammaproteobacteria bacterium TMED34]